LRQPGAIRAVLVDTISEVVRHFQIGDKVRVLRVPPFMEATDYPFPEVQMVFEKAIGNVFRVDYVDWDGWVSLNVEAGGIGIQPDCVELVQSNPCFSK
jgi:hypothetical protein